MGAARETDDPAAHLRDRLAGAHVGADRHERRLRMAVVDVPALVAARVHLQNGGVRAEPRDSLLHDRPTGHRHLDDLRGARGPLGGDVDALILGPGALGEHQGERAQREDQAADGAGCEVARPDEACLLVLLQLAAHLGVRRRALGDGLCGRGVGQAVRTADLSAHGGELGSPFDRRRGLLSRGGREVDRPVPRAVGGPVRAAASHHGHRRDRSNHAH